MNSVPRPWFHGTSVRTSVSVREPWDARCRALSLLLEHGVFIGHEPLSSRFVRSRKYTALCSAHAQLDAQKSEQSFLGWKARV